VVAELAGDDLTDLLFFDHFVDLSEGDPHRTVGLAGLQHHFLNGNVSVQAIKIIMTILVSAGLEQLELFRTGVDPGLLPELPGDGLETALPCLHRAAGILPGAGKGLFRGAAGQQ